MSTHGQHRAGLRPGCSLHRHHSAGCHARLLLDGRFQIFGVQVHPRGGHDHLALAPQEAQIAARHALGQVAGGQPLLRARLQRPAGPGRVRDRLTTHQHFAIRPQLHLAPRHWFADRPVGHMEGVIQRDQRRSLRHSVALHHHKSQRAPELLQRPRQRAAAGDHRPELQAEGAMRIAEAPPAPRHAHLLLRRGHALRQAGQSGFQMRLQQRHHARHRGQHADALALHGLDQPRGHQTALEVRLGGKDGRNPQPHRLPEDVAQRQRFQNAQWMHQQPLPAHVGLRSRLDGFHAGQHVAVGQHHALGIACGSRCEQDFERSRARKPCNGTGLFSGQRAEPVVKRETRPFCRQLMKQQRIADRQFGAHVGGHAMGKLGASVCVQRHRQHSAQQTAIKGGDPLGAVFPPQQNSVVRADAALCE